MSSLNDDGAGKCPKQHQDRPIGTNRLEAKVRGGTVCPGHDPATGKEKAIKTRARKDMERPLTAWHNVKPEGGPDSDVLQKKSNPRYKSKRRHRGPLAQRKKESNDDDERQAEETGAGRTTKTKK